MASFRKQETVLAYLLLAPMVLFMAAFMLYPMLYVFLMSLFSTDKIGRLQEFIFLGNYLTAIRDPEFWEITLRSGLWTAVGVTSKAVIGMIIALLLTVQLRGRRALRMLFILPWATSVPISALLWKWTLDHEFGLLNHTLKMLLIEQPPVWLGRPLPSFISTMWVDVWIGLPFMALMFLAGMQTVSADLYDSARIDGCGASQRFFYVTLPGIRHIIVVALLLSSLWTFNDFNVIYIMTRGGPAGATDILITGVYKSAFEWLRFSRASVMAMVTFFILAIATLFYSKLYFRLEDAR